MSILKAGASAANITPRKSVFLCGYPNVERNSTGVHDPLLSSALFLEDGRARVLIIANDILYISKALAGRVRRRIAKRTGVPEGHILVTATHTHSGPLPMERPHRQAGPFSHAPDPEYMAALEEGIVRSGLEAFKNTRPAEAGLAVADATGVGTNRRDPAGPSDLRVPVLSVRDAATHAPLALMAACCMHPTVMHEDSTLVSADFPGLMRQYLQRQVVGTGCPVVYHSGPAGNQSPRHVTRSNTFAEAERIGILLGRAIEKALAGIVHRTDCALAVLSARVDLPRQVFPPPAEAEAGERAALEKLEAMRRAGDPRTAVRTAECDWFGAAARATLSRAAADGRLAAAAAQCLPAEIQVIRIGPWTFVAWPGEVFIEFEQAIVKAFPDTYVIAYANGETDGYLVTAEAVAEGGYEASLGIFKSPESGERLVAATRDLLAGF